MPLTDIFNQKPFNAVELTAAFQDIDFIPMTLGTFGESLFPVKRWRTRMGAVYRTEGRAALIQTSPIGAPPDELVKKPTDMRPFYTRRLAKGSTLYAEELQGLLQAPLFDQTVGMQQEVADRAAMLRQDIETTLEHMRLGAIHGKVYDADGTSLLDDFYAQWGTSEDTILHMDLVTATTNVRLKCAQYLALMKRKAKGAWVEGQTTMHALCGETFFQQLVSHPNVEKLWLNWNAAAELRGTMAVDVFDFGGIVWHNYLGSDAGADVDFQLTAADECRFFPVNGRDVFQLIYGPAEFEPFVNQPGQDVYGISFPDRDRGAWQRVEAYCYPLIICLRPDMLFSADSAAT